MKNMGVMIFLVYNIGGSISIEISRAIGINHNIDISHSIGISCGFRCIHGIGIGATIQNLSLLA